MKGLVIKNDTFVYSNAFPMFYFSNKIITINKSSKITEKEFFSFSFAKKSKLFSLLDANTFYYL